MSYQAKFFLWTKLLENLLLAKYIISFTVPLMLNFFQNTCFKEHNNIAVQPNLWVIINLYKKNVFQLSHGIKNIHRTKLYQWYTDLGNTFLQLLLLKVCEAFLFRPSSNVYSILWSVQVFFAFLEKRRPNRYWLWEENLVFCMQIFSLTWYKVTFQINNDCNQAMPGIIVNLVFY